MVEWTILYTTFDYADAYIQAGRLKVESISTMVHHQLGASAFGITVGKLGEIHVLVHPQDYDPALDILESEVFPELPSNTENIIYLDPD